MLRLKKLKTLLGYADYLYRTSSSDLFTHYLRTRGVSIGKDVEFFSPRTISIDLTRPHLITIGNKVKITSGVIILTHGFDWCVLRECYKRPFGSAGSVKIGDNVFVGMNSIILKGVSIGNDVIIGAGSVVTVDIPSQSVAAGNPAKIIYTLKEYYKKRLDSQLPEAAEVARAIARRYNRNPQPQDFKEFFFLFLERNKDKFGSLPVSQQVGDYFEEFMLSEPHFSSFDQFLQFCLNKTNPPTSSTSELAISQK